MTFRAKKWVFSVCGHSIFIGKNMFDYHENVLEALSKVLADSTGKNQNEIKEVMQENYIAAALAGYLSDPDTQHSERDKELAHAYGLSHLL